MRTCVHARIRACEHVSMIILRQKSQIRPIMTVDLVKSLLLVRIFLANQCERAKTNKNLHALPGLLRLFGAQNIHKCRSQ